LISWVVTGGLPLFDEKVPEERSLIGRRNWSMIPAELIVWTWLAPHSALFRLPLFAEQTRSFLGWGRGGGLGLFLFGFRASLLPFC
jgi:hypothetical protein